MNVTSTETSQLHSVLSFPTTRKETCNESLRTELANVLNTGYGELMKVKLSTVFSFNVEII